MGGIGGRQDLLGNPNVGGLNIEHSSHSRVLNSSFPENLIPGYTTVPFSRQLHNLRACLKSNLVAAASVS
jgi:hypothetical protein